MFFNEKKWFRRFSFIWVCSPPSGVAGVDTDDVVDDVMLVVSDFSSFRHKLASYQKSKIMLAIITMCTSPYIYVYIIYKVVVVA